MPRLIYKNFFLFSLAFVLPLFACAQVILVNINAGGIDELKTLNGIGDVKAQAIIDYRETFGAFQKIEDIKNVKGIGDATFAKIKDFITVGETSSSSATSTSTNPEAPPVSSQNSENSDNSSHYSAAPLSSIKIPILFSVVAGRDRLSSNYSPLEFKAETDLPYVKNATFKWNFGDGAIDYGEKVKHVYLYPGDYLVVLSLTAPEGKAVSRVNVKIVEPKLLLIKADTEKIEVRNDSSYEVSLYGRALVSADKTFAFPEDTIIKSNQSITFSSNITGLKPTNLSQISIVVSGQEKPKQIETIKAQISALQNQISSLSPRQVAVSTIITSLTIASATSNLATAFEAVAEVSTEKSGIKNWWSTLKHFFLRTK